jgi:peroxiredoxin Q/BCP
MIKPRNGPSKSARITKRGTLTREFDFLRVVDYLSFLGTINRKSMRTGPLQTIYLSATLLSSFLISASVQAKSPAVGEPAPLVQGKDQDGKEWKLADVVGKKVVLLYFYPKDDTPGCTKEACGFRDRISDLKKENVEVVGVSFDSPESHQKFISKYNLNFPLVADTDGAIADAYGVRMTGKNMAKRTSFLIGLDGKIAHVTDTMNADTHLSEMKEAVAGLKKN